MVENKINFFCISIFILILFLGAQASPIKHFVKRKGTHFVVGGRPMYVNGFNAYWMMYQAADPVSRVNVSSVLQQVNAKYGMNVGRTWAFRDGDYRPLQSSPGVYHEDMFEGLDFVISEAKKNGVYLILTLVNNWIPYGGKKQYVDWARENGHYLKSYDDFFTDSVVKGYYKNHVKAILTRNNSITGIAYKDEPAIFAWELINEPRADNNITIQSWVEEMAAYVKSIDAEHLLSIGMEGFYGDSVPERTIFNFGFQAGTDFIANHLVPQVDFATIHLYDWPKDLKPNTTETALNKFKDKWIKAHLNDSAHILGKPLLLTEFGMNLRESGYPVSVRDAYFSKMYNKIYSTAKKTPASASAGALFWQVRAKGMDISFFDGLEVVLEDSPSTAAIISRQSRRLSSLI